MRKKRVLAFASLVLCGSIFLTGCQGLGSSQASQTGESTVSAAEKSVADEPAANPDQTETGSADTAAGQTDTTATAGTDAATGADANAEAGADAAADADAATDAAVQAAED